MVDIKKNIKYNKQQKELLEKLLKILNYNNNFTFYLYDLDNSKQLQNDILNLTNDIKKYYPCSGCPGVNNKMCKRPYLSIIRFLLKHHNKELFFTDYTLENKMKIKVRTKKYKILC